jgi:membrane protein required for beta-lactamase induction
MVAVLSLWRSRLIRIIPMPSQWSLTIRRIPSLIRLAAAPFIGYWLATILITPMWVPTQTSLRPVMLGSLLTLLVFYVLFPPLPVVPGQTQETQPTRY